MVIVWEEEQRKSNRTICHFRLAKWRVDMKAIIGVAPLYDMELQRIWMWDSYTGAIEAAGGIPILLPIKNRREDYERLLDIVTGIVLTGGHDINPLLYGENISKYNRAIIPERDETEIMLFKTAFKRGIPILGICRGEQLINVAMGGSLYQDIYEQAEASIKHEQGDILPRDYPVHRVSITINSRLFECYNRDSIMVNSLHHQAVKKLAPGLIATSYSEDGIIEAIEYESRDRFLLGVQWHPEAMFRRDEDASKLFKYFIKHCSPT